MKVGKITIFKSEMHILDKSKGYSNDMIGSTGVKSCSRGQTLKESRLQALKITREIQGFGSSLSPSLSSSSSTTPWFGSYSTTTSPTWSDLHEERISEKSPFPEDTPESHIWEATLTSEVEEEEKPIKLFKRSLLKARGVLSYPPRAIRI
ncbi:hypothetical protein SDJN02_10003, partial [Cucurbita argyrosperma subsp. argyrosperma]